MSQSQGGSKRSMRINSEGGQATDNQHTLKKTYVLSLSRDTDCDAIAARIKTEEKSIHVLKIKSSRGQEEPDWNSDAVRELFLDLASIKTLQEISLQNFGMHSNSIPLYMLTMLLSTSSPLKSFHLSYVSLIGTANDITAIAGCLQQLRQLESFRLSYCGFS